LQTQRWQGYSSNSVIDVDFRRCLLAAILLMPPDAYHSTTPVVSSLFQFSFFSLPLFFFFASSIRSISPRLSPLFHHAWLLGLISPPFFGLIFQFSFLPFFAHFQRRCFAAARFFFDIIFLLSLIVYFFRYFRFRHACRFHYFQPAAMPPASRFRQPGFFDFISRYCRRAADAYFRHISVFSISPLIAADIRSTPTLMLRRSRR
jgi:hypothetical protein